MPERTHDILKGSGPESSLAAVLGRVAGATNAWRRLEQIFESVPALVMITDLVEQKAIWCNDRARSYFDDDPVALGSNVAAAFAERVDDDSRQRLIAHFMNLANLDDDSVASLEFRMRHRDGSWRWLVSEDHVYGKDDPDFPTIIISSAMDVTELKQREAEQRFLTMELDHRVKNTLSIIQSVANQTASTPETKAFSKSLMARVQGLVSSQDALQKDIEPGAALRDVLESQYQIVPERRLRQIHAEGPDLRVRVNVFQTFGMVFHELLVNALAYGALSDPRGNVSVRWNVEQSEDGLEKWLTVVWSENDGPKIGPRIEHGFGTKMATEVVAIATQGEVEQKLKPSGIEWRLRAPAHAVLQ